MKPSHVSRLLCGCACGALLCAAAPALAQEIANDVVVLKEIVLTGEKVERSLAQTAASVTVIGEGEIEKDKEVETVEKAIKDVPNLTFYGTVGAPTIRGQDSQGPNSGAGAFFGGTVPRASINVDGRYLTYNEYAFGAASIWDASVIEVFRGPQTTSQGANSIAGAIIVNTNDPTFEREGRALLEYGSNNRRRAAVVYSAPIAKDLAARVALDYSARDTFIDYISDSFAKGASDQNFEAKTARVKLLWVPADLPGFEAKLTLSHNQTNRPTSESAFAPFENLESRARTMPSWKQRTNSAVLDMRYDFGNGMTLVNQLQYSDVNSRRMIEPITSGGATIDQNSLSNETRLLFGDADAPGFSGVAGLYVSQAKTDETLLLRGTSTFKDQKDSLGIYAEGTWRWDSPWSVTAGLRYQRDRVQRSGVSSFAASGLDYDKTFREWLPKVSVAYQMSDRTTLGAMVSKGYNPGGVTLNFRSGEYAAFDPETVWNYEVFARSEVSDNLRLTGNLFYSDFADAQRYVQVSLPESIGQSLTVNAETAKSYGLELGMDWQARDDLRLRGGLGLLHTEIGKFSSAQADFTGKEFSRAPGHTISLAADWDITPQLRLSGDIGHTDGYFSDDENTVNYEIASYTVANARLTYTANNGMQVYGYVSNIFDERATLNKMINRSAGGIEATMLEPREFGIGLSHRF